MTGILWLDNTKIDLAGKIEGIARQVGQKHQTQINTILVHPAHLNGAKEIMVGGVKVVADKMIYSQDLFLAVLSE